MKEFDFITGDQKILKAYHWDLQEKHPDYVMIIVHGMAEHALRYSEFAEFLNKRNVEVFSYDQRAFGKSAESKCHLGYPFSNDSWLLYCSDLVVFTNHIKSIIKHKYENVKVAVFGHSMGSLVVRSVLLKEDNIFDFVILSGTTQTSSLLLYLGIFLSSLYSTLYGPMHRSTFLNKLVFYNYNKKFRSHSNKTFEWLSRDKNEVDKYIEDEYCGFPLTNQFYNGLFKGILELNKVTEYMNIKKDLPILLISGEDDPVGNFGKGVKKAYEMYKISGLNYVELKLYKDARHELLKEINRNEIMECIDTWVREYLNKIKH